MIAHSISPNTSHKLLVHLNGLPRSSGHGEEDEEGCSRRGDAASCSDTDPGLTPVTSLGVVPSWPRISLCWMREQEAFDKWHTVPERVPQG